MRIKILSIELSLILMLIGCGKDTSTNPSISGTKLASVIFKPTSGRYAKPYATFYITDRNVLDLTAFRKVECSFEAEDYIGFQIITPIDTDLNKILIFWKAARGCTHITYFECIGQMRCLTHGIKRLLKYLAYNLYHISLTLRLIDIQAVGGTT